MGSSIPDTPEQAKLIGNARVRARLRVQAFADEAGARESVSVSCERASLAVDEYCADLLQYLITTNPPSSEAETAWLRSRYLILIVEFGSAIRDAIRDSETRHAAAQGIQFRVLEHERHLRLALESAAHVHSPVVAINPGTTPSVPLAQQKTYLAQTDITPETV